MLFFPPTQNMPKDTYALVHDTLQQYNHLGRGEKGVINAVLYERALKADFEHVVRGPISDTDIGLKTYHEPLDSMRFFLSAIFYTNPRPVRHSSDTHSVFTDPSYEAVFDIFHLCEHNVYAKQLSYNGLENGMPKFLTVSVIFFPPSISFFTVRHNGVFIHVDGSLVVQLNTFTFRRIMSAFGYVLFYILVPRTTDLLVYIRRRQVDTDCPHVISPT